MVNKIIVLPAHPTLSLVQTEFLWKLESSY